MLKAEAFSVEHEHPSESTVKEIPLKRVSAYLSLPQALPSPPNS